MYQNYILLPITLTAINYKLLSIFCNSINHCTRLLILAITADWNQLVSIYTDHCMLQVKASVLSAVLEDTVAPWGRPNGFGHNKYRSVCYTDWLEGSSPALILLCIIFDIGLHTTNIGCLLAICIYIKFNSNLGPILPRFRDIAGFLGSV